MRRIQGSAAHGDEGRRGCVIEDVRSRVSLVVMSKVVHEDRVRHASHTAQQSVPTSNVSE